MVLDETLLDEFRRIYFEEFGEQITSKEAYDKFLRLINLLRVILRHQSTNDKGVPPDSAANKQF